jgi:GTP-dependent phosphoenolpyruvate carboxykinase
VTTTRLRVGMGDAYGIRITVLAAPDFDPAAVTAAVMKITKPSGAAVNWTAALASQSSLSVQATYTFATAGTDLDVAGTWSVWVQFTQPGKTIGPRCEVVQFTVVAANAP